LGARLIYRTLQVLAERRAFNIVENVIFMGSPVPARNTASWRAIRSIVAGRVVNCYAQDDWVLGFVYRGGSLEWGVAGLEKIEGVPGIENFDVSGLVSGHLQYRFVLGEILEEIGMYGLDRKVIAIRAEEAEKEEKELDSVGRTDVDETDLTEKLHTTELKEETKS
jgi:hypothetical protein